MAAARSTRSLELRLIDGPPLSPYAFLGNLVKGAYSFFSTAAQRITHANQYKIFEWGIPSQWLREKHAVAATVRKIKAADKREDEPHGTEAVQHQPEERTGRQPPTGKDPRCQYPLDPDDHERHRPESPAGE